MKGVGFRKARGEDVSLLAEIERASFLPTEAFPKRHIRSLLRNVHGTILSEVILWDDEVAGWACWMFRRGSRVVRLYSLALFPSFRGRGIGEAYLRERFKEFSRVYAFCHLEVRVSNERAQALYRRLGFEVKERLPLYYGDEDGYRMRLDLQSYRSL
ncbi:MAG: GNAT family N-acetyltransferase [Brevinematales bacterium]|nr:GNAT family N-acetyltransferase [Brevinematales bacterium]